MADYYTLFVINIPLKTDGEKEWCIKALRDFRTLLDLVGDEEGNERFERLSNEYPIISNGIDENGWDFLEFDGSLTAVDADTRMPSLRIVADENGNVDQAGVFLQSFLQKLRPTEAIAFTWANTCNKMREDGFDGGAMFITATEIKYLSAFQWCEEQWTEFRMRQGKDGSPS